MSFGLKKISLIIVWILVVWVSIIGLITPSQNEKNTTIINGHLDHIEKGVGTGRNNGDIWYDLYIKESSQYYRISADNSKCFLYDSIQSQLKTGQPIKLYIDKPIPVFSFGKPMVVSVVADNKNYLFFDCVNNTISNHRIEFPVFSVLFGFFISLLIYKRRWSLA